MRRGPASPLPQRFGLDPVRMRTPDDGRWATLRDHLVERLPRLDPADVDAMLEQGRIVDLDGPVGVDSPFRPGHYLWFHRPLPDEAPVPFPIGVVHRDHALLVADKPHFLATIPRGRHVTQTALVKLRTEHGLPELSPAHRLDRATAGLVMFVVRREHRGAYQTLFRDRLVRKTYEAIAPFDPELELPRTVRSRIVKERGVHTAHEVPGEPNAITDVEVAEVLPGGLARYRLTPHTGRTHQLRLHMSGLGIPIEGDDLYPRQLDTPLDDFTRPLQLLAARLEFDDPVTGAPRRFVTRLALSTGDRPRSGVNSRAVSFDHQA